MPRYPCKQPGSDGEADGCLPGAGGGVGRGAGNAEPAGADHAQGAQRAHSDHVAQGAHDQLKHTTSPGEAATYA